MAEAKASLSEHAGWVAAGERVAITRRGKAVAILTASAKPRKPI